MDSLVLHAEAGRGAEVLGQLFHASTGQCKKCWKVFGRYVGGIVDGDYDVDLSHVWAAERWVRSELLKLGEVVLKMGKR